MEWVTSETQSGSNLWGLLMFSDITVNTMSHPTTKVEVGDSAEKFENCYSRVTTETKDLFHCQSHLDQNVTVYPLSKCATHRPCNLHHWVVIAATCNSGAPSLTGRIFLGSGVEGEVFGTGDEVAHGWAAEFQHPYSAVQYSK